MPETVKIKQRKICHISSVHTRGDVRIFHKQCKSLAQAGFEVILVVADGKGDEVVEQVSILDVGASKSRFDRIWKTTKCIFKKAQELDADLYHFHDPELIFVGLCLKNMKKQVIYDVHEDLPRDILSKKWIPSLLRKPISVCVELFENWAAKKISVIVTSTPFIRERFDKKSITCIDINNFPIITELALTEICWSEKSETACYVGGISEIRGIKEIIQAIYYSSSQVELVLAGTFSQEELKSRMMDLDGWNRVNELGWLNRNEIQSVLMKAKVGLVTLHPIVNYIDALPVKMFEYMAAGIPVIASNFPLWKEIIETAECGICVDPLDPKEIAKAIDYIISHPEEAEEMGRKGRIAVLEKYNWENETIKLVNLYHNILY